MPKLPQLVSGKSKKAIYQSGILFKKVSKKIIYTKVIEAELIKLFSNAYRYIHFSISNQFYTICEKFDINYKTLRENMIEGYERNKSMPKAAKMMMCKTFI